MTIEQSRHLAYLLHLRQVKRDSELVWWASLENPLTGERQAFSDLEELSAFLDEKTAGWSWPPGDAALDPNGETAARLQPPISRPGSRYMSYLIRLLRVDRAGRPTWQVALQSPATAERWNFADLQALVAFLKEKLCETDG